MREPPFSEVWETARVSMGLSVLMNAINIALNAVLVALGYGVLGVALATLVSRVVCGICMTVWLPTRIILCR